jgi:hypothetical protein
MAGMRAGRWRLVDAPAPAPTPEPAPAPAPPLQLPRSRPSSSSSTRTTANAWPVRDGGPRSGDDQFLPQRPDWR